jgi:hypothetical protein
LAKLPRQLSAARSHAKTLAAPNPHSNPGC